MLDGGILEQRLDELSLTAAQVEHALRARAPQDADDAGDAFLVEPQRRLDRRLFSRVLLLRRVRVWCVVRGQARERLARKVTLAFEVPISDELMRGVRQEPSFALRQQLIDLVASDP